MAKLYTFDRTSLTNGWAPANLGAKGRASKEVNVIHDALPERVATAAKIALRGGVIILTPEADEDATSHAVIIKTEAAYTRGAPGDLTHKGGGFSLIAEGWTQWGDAGRLGTHPHAMLVVKEGEEALLRATFSGGTAKGGGRRWLAALVRDGRTVLVPLSLQESAPVDQRPEFTLRPGEGARLAGRVAALLGAGEDADKVTTRLLA